MIVSALFEKRATLNKANPRDPVVAEWFGGGVNTASGESVTPDGAMRLTAVYAAVRLLSSNIATLPLVTYRPTKSGKEPVLTSTVFNVLAYKPNKWQTSTEWREMMAAHLFLRGNAYSYIVRNGSGQVVGLMPLHPDRVQVVKVNDSLAYKYCDESGGEHVYLQEEIHHWRGLSLDGITGVSPITYARETIGLSMAAETFGGAYFGNGTVLSGVLEHPNSLSDTAYDRLKKSWADRHQGAVKAHKPAILEEGMKFTQLGVKPEEAQFLETRKFQVAEIARLYGVPPHMIGDVEGSTSWGSGIEQQSIGFVVYSLRPVLVKIEQAIKRDLLNLSSQSSMFAKFKVEGLLRGDSKSRSAYYKDMWNIGVLSINDIRRLEDFNDIDKGQDHYVPMNMMKAGDEIEQNNFENEDQEEDRQLNFDPIIEDIADRLTSFHNRSTERGKVDEEKRAAFIKRALGPLFMAAGKELIEIDFNGDILAQIKKGLNDG